MFYEEFKRNPGCAWIMKPVGRAQGKGIFLFTKLSQISEWQKAKTWAAHPASHQADHEEEVVETYVAQRYIENPHLIGGTKYLRRSLFAAAATAEAAAAAALLPDKTMHD